MPSVKLDDIFRRYALNVQTWHKDSPARVFSAAAREVTGTPDTYVEHTGETRNIASADYGPSPFMLGDVYAGEHTVAHWGPNALPDMVRLADARVLGWQFERLLGSQPLTPALSTKIIAAIVYTDDVKQASRLFGVLINNPSLPEPHRRALIDWVLRRTESRDITDPTTGKLQKPKLSSPPSAEDLVKRLEAQADPGMRAFAPGLGKAGGVSPEVLKRAVLVAMADPNPLVRNTAAPLLRQVAPPSRQRINDLVDAYFSKDAKAKVRAEIAAEVGPLPANADIEGDVLPRGDFWPSRMQAAAEMQAEFLGTMLQHTPQGPDLEWLIGVAVEHARHNYGLTADVLAAMRRNGATPQAQADAIIKLMSYADDVYPFLSRSALDLVAQDPSLADALKNVLSPELVNAPVGGRIDVLKKSDAGLAALVRAGKLTAADVIPRIQAQPVSSELLKTALDHGAKPVELLNGLLKNLNDSSGRQTFIAALALVKQANLPPADLDQAMLKLMGAKALTYYGVNDIDTRGIPGPPMQDDPLAPEFPPPQGTLSQALLGEWLKSSPSSARVEAVVTGALATTNPDRKAWLMHEFSWAGADSPTLAQERDKVWQRLKADALGHATTIGDFITPASGHVHVGDVEKSLLKAARTHFADFKPQPGPTIDTAAALTAAKAAPPAQRVATLWQKISADASPAVKALKESAVVDFGAQLPPVQSQAFLDEVVRLEADRITTVPAVSRFREAWGTTMSALFGPGASFALSAPAVIDFATRVPELKSTVAYWLTTPAAAGARAEVIAALPDLATPPAPSPTSSELRSYVPPLPELGDTAATMAELTARLEKLTRLNERLAASPNNNDLVFAQDRADREYHSQVFKLVETKQAATLTDAELKPFVDSLGPTGQWLEFCVALNRGDDYDTLAAKYKDLEGLDWAAADAVNDAKGSEAALGQLLLSGERMSNPTANDFTQPIVLTAAGRAKAPEAVRKQLLIDGLFEDPLPALKGVLLWNGPSLDWAMPALTELATGTGVENRDYVASLQSLLPMLVGDARLSNEQAVQLAVSAVANEASGAGWRDISQTEQLSAGPMLAEALKRPGLTAAQRDALLGAAVASGRWREAKAGMTDAEVKALSDHMLGLAWKTTNAPVDGRLSSLLSLADQAAARG